MTCYCGGKYICAKHRQIVATQAPLAPKLEADARPATPEETAFVREILGIVADR